MAKKQSQKKRPQKQKIEWRRVFVAGLAVVMALLRAVEASYEKNKERWVDTLFSLIVGVQP